MRFGKTLLAFNYYIKENKVVSHYFESSRLLVSYKITANLISRHGIRIELK